MAAVIGILGGMGPFAGQDLFEKIFDQTVASTDQEHLPVALLSYPERIVDRSTFLFDETQPSPVEALTQIARQLDEVGAEVIGVPCNTAHDPRIWGEIARRLEIEGRRARLVHMIDETARFIREEHPEVRRVGVLASLAVFRFGIYERSLEEAGLEAVVPGSHAQEAVVNPVIFDPDWGIKAQSHPVTATARERLLEGIDHVRARGAEAVILGCTEFPIAVPEPAVDGLPLVDPTLVLARALIRETSPEKLRPLGEG